MSETKKAAHGEQPDKGTESLPSDSIIPQTPSVENIERIPTELKERNQWVLWRLELRDGKPTKIPYTPARKKASSTDEQTWTSFDNVIKTYEQSNGYFKGIGYVFSNEDPFTGIDLDDCVNDEGELNSEAKQVVKELNSFTERSQSKTGVHVIIKGSIPGERNRTGDYEMYETGRFFCVTGSHVSDTPETIEERQQELNVLYNRLFNKPRESRKQGTSRPAPISAIMDNQDILSVALKAKNGNKFAALYSGDWSSYGSQSEADLALCNLLAFYTKDAGQIDQLFRGSDLMREKWDRDDYAERTIEAALSTVTEQYRGRSADNVIDIKKSATVIKHPAIADMDDDVIHGENTRFRNTDLGNSKRLVHYFGHDLRFCKKFGAWYIWDGKRWDNDETGEIERKAKDTVLNIYKEALEEEDEKRVALMKHATGSESRQKISNMISLAQTEREVIVTPDQLDADHWTLNCENGVIDLKTGKLLTHSRKNFVTRLIPTIYDQKAECPTWERFINRIMQDDNGNVRADLVEFLQKAVGYALTGDISEQVMFVLHGAGRNGKSTFINTIKDLLGDYARQASTETFVTKQNTGNANTDIARLKGSRLVSAVESEQGKRLAESLVKQLTGGEPITARFLYQDEFEFKPSFKIFLTTNHKPEIRGTDRGIWRRIKLIPFTVTIPTEEVDTKLDEKLKKEFPGILRWAVEGCLKWQRDGLQEPKEVREATEGYREEMDILLHFVNDCCVINPRAKVAAKNLYLSYQRWCDDNGEYSLKQRKFIEQLKEGYPIEVARMPDKSGSRGWQGIGLLHESDTSDMSDAKNGNYFESEKGKENKEKHVRSIREETERQVAVGAEMVEGEL